MIRLYTTEEWLKQLAFNGTAGLRFKYILASVSCICIYTCINFSSSFNYLDWHICHHAKKLKYVLLKRYKQKSKLIILTLSKDINSHGSRGSDKELERGIKMRVLVYSTVCCNRISLY